jgi:hypothetical protein
MLNILATISGRYFGQSESWSFSVQLNHVHLEMISMYWEECECVNALYIFFYYLILYQSNAQIL